MISLRKYGYRMDMDRKSRRLALRKAICEKGHDKVLKRLEYLLINQRYVYQTELDIKFCLRKMFQSINIK